MLNQARCPEPGRKAPVVRMQRWSFSLSSGQTHGLQVDRMDQRREILHLRIINQHPFLSPRTPP